MVTVRAAMLAVVVLAGCSTGGDEVGDPRCVDVFAEGATVTDEDFQRPCVRDDGSRWIVGFYGSHTCDDGTVAAWTNETGWGVLGAPGWNPDEKAPSAADLDEVCG